MGQFTTLAKNSDKIKKVINQDDEQSKAFTNEQFSSAKFTTSKITLNSESIGEILKRARREKKYNLKKAAQRTDINIKYLKALESGRRDLLPAGIYARNYLRDYALFLNLKPKELIKQFDLEEKKEVLGKNANPFLRKVPKFQYLISVPKIIKNSIIIFLVLICVIYLWFLINKIISPPLLIITFPDNNFTTEETFITITGQTDPEAGIKINGKDILLTSQGNFSQKINLKSDLNTITIAAKKKYSKEQILIRKILVKNAIEK